MRGAGLAVLFVLGFGAAGAFSATVVPSTTSTGTVTTDPATATTETTTTAATTSARTATTVTTRSQRKPDTLPPEVTIAGIPVGGLAAVTAYVTVRAAFEEPLVLRLGERSYSVPPVRLGAVAYARRAVDEARTAAPGSDVRLPVLVSAGKARSYLAGLARRFDRAPVDSRLRLRGLRPLLTRDVPGRRLDREEGVRRIVAALEAWQRGPLPLPLRALRPKVTRASFGPVIVIRRASHRLFLYRGMRLWRTFGVAVGQPSYPTPLGRFTIVVRWRDPWWYPPPSPWAEGEKPVPPGPGNPLGTRWLGLSAPAVGIHGTPDAASIGYSASHGCIRMRIPEAEWLFDHVGIGTTVFIVPE